MRWATSETCWMSGRWSGSGLMQASTRRRSCVCVVCVGVVGMCGCSVVCVCTCNTILQFCSELNVQCIPCTEALKVFH